VIIKKVEAFDVFSLDCLDRLGIYQKFMSSEHDLSYKTWRSILVEQPFGRHFQFNDKGLLVVG
jgi:hypothetical protein